MPRKTDRNFLADFQTLDIEYLPEKGPEVSSDIQMVYVMGNVAPAAAVATFTPGYSVPVPVLNHYWARTTSPATVGEFGRRELISLATGNGIWFVGAISGVSNIDMNVFTIAAETGLATRLLPTAANATAFGSGADATAILDSGTIVGAAGADRFLLNIGEASAARSSYLLQPPMYVSPGRVLVLQAFVANLFTDFSMSWIEMP